MSLAVPPPFARMASKRISNVDYSASASSAPVVPAHTTTAAASLSLTPPSVRPPAAQSLKHATLATLDRYQTHTLTPTAFSTTTPPTYNPRSTTPLPPSAFTHSADSNQNETVGKSTVEDTALLDSLLAGNRERESADRRLRLDVADRVGRWSHEVALQGERAVQQMDAMHNRRVEGGVGSGGGQQNIKAGEEEKESVSLGWTLKDSNTNDQLPWKRTDQPTQPASDGTQQKKLSKKDKDREELETRMRNMSLAYSPQSLPPAVSYLDGLLAAAGSGYVGSALAVSLSAFRGSEPLVVSETASEMVSSSAVLPAASMQASSGAPTSSAVASSSAATAINVKASPNGTAIGSPFPTASALHEEVSRVKACVAAAGMYVHAGAVERALGSDRAVAGAASSGSGGAWPVPFSGLVDDPKDKKKRAGGDKKAAVKKAAKKK